MMRLWFCFLPHGCEKRSRRIHTRDAHLVLHGSFSWLFIRRRGRLRRRWMFLRTTRGTRSTCRFCAVVSWMEILIDFGSTIFSRTCWKCPKWGWFNFTYTLWTLWSPSYCLVSIIVSFLYFCLFKSRCFFSSVACFVMFIYFLLSCSNLINHAEIHA